MATIESKEPVNITNVPVLTKRIRKDRWNTRPTFSQWLYFQADSRGMLGKLARWVYSDNINEEGYREPCWPHRSNTLTHLIIHLRTWHAKPDKTIGPDEYVPTELDLRKAFDEYRAFIASGGKVPVRTGGTIATNRNVHRGYLIAKETVTQIRELAKWSGVKQGEVIERLVAAAYNDHAPKKRARRT